MLYFAYGSNLNIARMKARCPKAEPICKLMLADSRLVFRGVADCIYSPGDECPGGIWHITDECERALDIYEGWRPDNDGMYRKDYIPVVGVEGVPGVDPAEAKMMFYYMNSTGIMPPSQGYLDCIVQGYRDFRLPMKPLREAVRSSWEDKAPSHVERRRHARNGRPRLALSKTVPLKKAAR